MKLMQCRVNVFLSLFTAFSLLFTGCTPAADPEGLFGSPSSAAQIREGDWDYELSQVPPHYPNDYSSFGAAQFCDYGEKILIADVSLGYFVLYEYDKRTGRIDTFCKDAVCDHKTEKCPSYDIMGLQLHGGNVYGFRILPEGDKELLVLKNGRFQSVIANIYFTHFHNGYLYAHINDGTLLRFPEGNYKEPQRVREDSPLGGHFFVGDYYYWYTEKEIKRFSLENPEAEETVLSFNNLLGTVNTDGSYLYYCDVDTFCLMRCELDGSDPRQLTEIPAWPPTVTYDDAYFYFQGYDPTDRSLAINRQLFRMKRDLSAEPELLADVGTRCGDIYVPYMLDALLMYAGGGYYIINRDGSGLQKLELPV